MRSPKTSEYDILEVTGDWTVWAGELYRICMQHLSFLLAESHDNFYKALINKEVSSGLFVANVQVLLNV